jgi:MoaA/NifB/PqqE/SkfB family radical SAM enzyme/SAM-dependent methyltransferase
MLARVERQAFLEQASALPVFARLDPRLAVFLTDHLVPRLVTRFGDQWVLSTHLPPFPSLAFARLLDQIAADRPGQPRLHSVTLGVTNRCPYRCWHCYNAGRLAQDLPVALLRQAVAHLQERGLVMLALSGGEPLLRDDLEELVAGVDPGSCVTVNTTGYGLTPQRAAALRQAGVFALGVSLDAPDAATHDRLRGHPGAWATARQALALAADAGLFPYAIAVATRQFLQPEVFWPYLEVASAAGAREVHLLEPCPTGRLEGHAEVALAASERQLLRDYQRQVDARPELPAISSLAQLEAADAFGCGAGASYLYLDGSGEVCPCNLVPLSFGNFAHEPLPVILDRMRAQFPRPRCRCLGQVLAPQLPAGPRPLPLPAARALCATHLPADGPLPAYAQIQAELHGDGAAPGAIGATELRAAYDQVHADYDAFWVAQAGTPVRHLVQELAAVGPFQRGLEAGCGTGFATALLLPLLAPAGRLLAVDLSPQMLAQARRRLGAAAGVSWRCGDALAELAQAQDLDLVFTSWVLGYIPRRPFLAAAAAALRPGGRLALVVHRDGSPREPLELFAALVALDPSVLQRQVRFDFPAAAQQLAEELAAAGFALSWGRTGEVRFACPGSRGVVEHLLKSGAGTAFHDAVDPARRGALMAEFERRLTQLHPTETTIDVVHDYIAVIAVRR